MEEATRDFCSDPLWDLNLTWYTNEPDFTHCFHSTVLVYLPCAILWLGLPVKLYEWRSSTSRQIPWTPIILARMFAHCLLILDCLAQCIFEWTAERPIANILAPLVFLATFALVIGLEWQDLKNGVSSSGVQYGLWFLLAITSTLTFTSFVRFPNDHPVGESTLFFIFYALVIVEFFLVSWASPPGKYKEFKDHVVNPSPELNASYPSRMTFAWFDGTIKRGWKNPIKEENLHDVNPDSSCKKVTADWTKFWNFQYERKTTKADSNSKPKMTILPTMFLTFGTTYLLASINRLITILLQQATPNVLGMLINFVTSGEEMWKGYFYMILLVVLNMIKTIMNSQYFYGLGLIGLRIRSALTSALFKKALILGPSARKELTIGETVNLMAIDTQRMMDVTNQINTIWTAPLTILLSLYFLWGYLGPSCLAGLVVMVLLIPINAFMSNKMKKYQISNMKNKDTRIKVMNEILDGIKVLKLYAWEPSFARKVEAIREKEVETLKKMSYLGAVQTFMFTAAPFMVTLASFATYVLVDPNNVLDAEIAFVSLSYFNLMRMPLNQIPFLIVQLIQATVSLKRLNDFLNADEVDKSAIGKQVDDQSNAIEAKNASFMWNADHHIPTLNNLSFSVKKGSCIAIVGKVGSGKSSILSALIGDMVKAGGRVNVNGSVAYVPQQAWIQNATLKYNVIFGQKMSPAVYRKVVDACALRADFDILMNGDMTEIGEKGINLSGGQKQRVSVARAVYNNADIYLLDDPLSAVDSHVGKHMFDQVIGPQGLLKNKTRVLVTNSVSFLPAMDYIIVMEDGRISEAGTYKELLARKEAFAEYLMEHLKEAAERVEGEDETELEELKQEIEAAIGKEKVEAVVKAARSAKSNISSLLSGDNENRSYQRGVSKVSGRGGGNQRGGRGGNAQRGRGGGGRGGGGRNAGQLIGAETLETTKVKGQVYVIYAKAVGLGVSVSILLLQIVTQVFSLGTNFWLAAWSDDPDSGIPEVRNVYLGVYGGLGGASAITVGLSSLLVTIGGLFASSKLHSRMLNSVFHAPMSFFDTNPKGRVVNRFAKDVDSIDRQIPMVFSALLRLLFSVIGTIGAIVYATPIFVVVIVPLSLIYFFVQRIYVETSRQLKRLESNSRSPIYSLFGETLSGVSTIRAYNLQDKFIYDNERGVDRNQAAYLPNIAATRWLSIRLEMLGNIITLFAALFAVLGRDTLDAGLVGLMLNYASQITMTLNFLIRQTSQVETSMVSVERIKEYQDDLEQEAPYEMPDQDPKDGWPQYGEIEFKDYKVRYRPGLELVLKGVNCKILRGEKIGVVGRTGAGKSSLTLALFRIIEPAEGSISIDNADITHMGVGHLRSRLTIIPQDPVLFSGSLRSNIDPFEAYSDEEIWKVLHLSHLKSFVSSMPSGLEYEIAEGGTNLSVGQKQLVCLARALLRKTKILILDEATASVDLDTDDLIQATIREEFSDCTVITIAHRLNTIMDSNRIMVLSDGQILELESPTKLLQDPESAFYKMAKDAGLV